MKIKRSIKRVIVGLLTFSVCVCLMLSSVISVNAERVPGDRGDDLQIDETIEDDGEVRVVEPEAPTATPYEMRITLEIDKYPFESGSGKKDDPYIVNSASDLFLFGKRVNNKGEDYKGQYIKLGRDINLNEYCGEGGEDWTPIGRVDKDGWVFNGTFDGGGHTISGLYIGNGGNYTGLFAELGGDAVLKNLNVKGNVKGNYMTAGIVAYSGGRIENCTFTGKVTGKAERTGGIAGECRDVINCGVKGDIYSGGKAGGIAGFIKHGNKVEKCKFNGTVSPYELTPEERRNFVFAEKNQAGSKEYGGIAGTANGSIYNCESVGEISGRQDAGGIVGSTGTNSTVSNCVFAKGTVYTSYELSGGIVGYHCGKDIYKCVNKGNISADRYSAGGITGCARGPVSGCENYGDVSGEKYVGGIAGENMKCHDNIGVLTSCISFGLITGVSRVGGIIGDCNRPIVGCLFHGDVKGSGEYVGYIAGYVGENVSISAVGSVFGEGSWVMIIIYSSVTLIVIAAATFFIRRRRSKVRRD